MMKKDCRGFTLAELLIVVAIIAVLVAVAIPIFNAQLEKSREAYDIATLRQAAALAAEKYYEGATSKEGAAAAGLLWDGNGSSEKHNAYGIYDPKTASFLPIMSGNAEGKGVKAYGKGTVIDAGTEFVLGNPNGAYIPSKDYRTAVAMVSIYPEAKNKHIIAYWKTIRKSSDGTDKSKYVGLEDNTNTNHPKYSIRIDIN